MPVDPRSKKGQIVRQLIPFSTMPVDQFNALCENITIETAKPNTFLFKRNDAANDLVYLIKGSIKLQSDNLVVETINSGSESSKFALAHQIPRKIDAITLSTVHFLRLDSNILNTLPSVSYEHKKNSHISDKSPEEDSDDWMTTLLKSPIFRALPPTNLQKIIIGLEEVHFDKGETIIKQGEQGDFYYLIKKGNCLISRKPSANAKEIKLAKLYRRDTFGEDSLLSGEPRNVSIIALSEVSLLRLSKDKFISLIKEPSLKFIEHSQIPEKLIEGATLIDVRSPDEYQKHSLPHSINTPFFSLRMYVKSINKDKPAIVVCENGKSSEAAAFLLLRNKINTQIIKGGMGSLATKETTANSQRKATQRIKPESTASDTKINSDNPLHLENQKLKQTIWLLQAEKEVLEKKYRILYKQTEKLKSVLDTLKS